MKPDVFQAVGMLCASNLFMTVAWYGHLRSLSERPWSVAALVSWGLALFDTNYLSFLDYERWEPRE
jgi:hypothetical protein